MEKFIQTSTSQTAIDNALLKERYNIIINFILNNSKLNYDKTKLTIDYGELVLEYIKTIEPEYYKAKFEELTKVTE